MASPKETLRQKEFMKRILIEKYSNPPAPTQNELDIIYNEYDREQTEDKAVAATDLQHHIDSEDAHSKAVTSSMADLRCQHKFDEAIALGEERLIDFTGKPYDNFQIRDILAKCYLSKAENTADAPKRDALIDLAFSHIRAGLKQVPDDASFLRALSKAYLAKEEPKNAVDTLLRIARNKNGKKTNIYADALDICHKYKMYDTAEIIGEKLMEHAEGIEDAKKRYIETARGYSIKAWARLSQGHIVKASETIDAMIKYLQQAPDIEEHLMHKEMAIAFHQKAKVELSSAQPNEALKAVNTAIFHRKKVKEALHEDNGHRDIELLGMKLTTLQKLGRHEDAEKIRAERDILIAANGKGTGTPE